MLKYEVVDRWCDVLKLDQEWNGLLEQTPQRDNLFLTHEWFRAWWEAFGKNRDLRILLIRSGGRLIAIAPLMRSWTTYHGLPVRVLSLITNDHTNRADLIVSERLPECVGLVLDFMARNSGRWDMTELEYLPADSPTVAFIKDHASQFGMLCGPKASHESPFITLSGDWEGFYNGLDGRFRRNLRNREKRLAGVGRVEYDECAGNLDEFLEEMFVVGDRSWKGETKTAIASTAAFRCFYTRLAQLAEPKGQLSLHLLRVDGRPIAFHYSLKGNGTVYLLKTEYDMAYHTYSPGHQIQKHVLKSCYERGYREFDFLGPDMTWKRDWTDRVRPHVRLLMFHRGLRSRSLAFLELQAKPVLKRSRLIQRLRPAVEGA